MWNQKFVIWPYRFGPKNENECLTCVYFIGPKTLFASKSCHSFCNFKRTALAGGFYGNILYHGISKRQNTHAHLKPRTLYTWCYIFYQVSKHNDSGEVPLTSICNVVCNDAIACAYCFEDSDFVLLISLFAAAVFKEFDRK